jgi:hypothetical protein
MAAAVVAAVLAAPLLNGFGAATAQAHEPARVVAEDGYDMDKRPVVPPAILGTAKVGQTLSVFPGKWKPKPMAYFVKWYRVLPDGTKKLLARPGPVTYTIRARDRGTMIVAEVHADHDLYQGAVLTKPRLVK